MATLTSGKTGVNTQLSAKLVTETAKATKPSATSPAVNPVWWRWLMMMCAI